MANYSQGTLFYLVHVTGNGNRVLSLPQVWTKLKTNKEQQVHAINARQVFCEPLKGLSDLSPSPLSLVVMMSGDVVIRMTLQMDEIVVDLNVALGGVNSRFMIRFSE